MNEICVPDFKNVSSKIFRRLFHKFFTFNATRERLIYLPVCSLVSQFILAKRFRLDLEFRLSQIIAE